MFELTRQEKVLVVWICMALLAGALIQHYRQSHRGSASKRTRTAKIANARNGENSGGNFAKQTKEKSR